MLSGCATEMLFARGRLRCGPRWDGWAGMDDGSDDSVAQEDSVGRRAAADFAEACIEDGSDDSVE